MLILSGDGHGRDGGDAVLVIPGTERDRAREALPRSVSFLTHVLIVLGLGITLVGTILVPVLIGVRAAARGVDRTMFGNGRPLHIPPLPQRSTVYDARGHPMARLFLDQNRIEVPLRRIDPVTRHAVLAIEDHGFYHHGALDFESILRASLADLRAGAFVQGGSTIAQQLVKNTITGNADTLERKLVEAKDAFRLEQTYSKHEILGMYLNTVALGHGVYGFGTAARYYFGVPIGKLTLTQSALLAGMIASPATFDPLHRPKAARTRRNIVLQRMRSLHWVDPAQLAHARRAPLGLSPRYRHEATSSPQDYWTQFIVNRMLADPVYGRTYRARVRTVYQGGLKIYTTLQPDLQREAETAIRRRMTGPGLPQSAVVSIDPRTGAIEAMATGNYSFDRYGYNLATDPGGGRTAGSAFKAFTLAAALEQGISPNRVYNGSSPRTIPNCGGGETWHVGNAEPGSGSYPLWQATADSVNVVFAQVIDQVGPAQVARVAHEMGITSPLTAVCPLTLGTSPVSPLEMTSGYSTLANRGVHCRPFGIARVVSSAGEVLSRGTPHCERVMPASVADEETSMLENVIAFGTGTAASIGRPAAGKTGTGESYQDAWFVGYVPQLTTGVWVGYARAEVPMQSVPGYGAGFGGVLAAPIWHDFMIAATRNLPPRPFPRPGYHPGAHP